MLKDTKYMADLRAHWKAFKSPKAKRAGGINDCWLPPVDADKDDLKELHREKMALKRAKRRAA